MKSIVIYFSRPDENYVDGVMKYINKGNTEVIAEYIKKECGSELFKVERDPDYAKDYRTCMKESKVEQDENQRPNLKNYLESIADYDVVFIGAPVYWQTMPQPMFTCLEKLDFKEKTIMPFVTHEGSEFGRVIKDIEKIAKGACVKPGLAIKGSSVKNSKLKVLNWIHDNLKA